jgi:hypothetical protein
MEYAYQATTQLPEQQPVPWVSPPSCWKLFPVGPPAPGPVGRPVCCSWTLLSECSTSMVSNITHPIVFPDFSYEIAERLVDINALFSRCFDKLAVEVLGQITALCGHSSARERVTGRKTAQDTRLRDEKQITMARPMTETYHSCQPVAHIPSHTYSRPQ